MYIYCHTSIRYILYKYTKNGNEKGITLNIYKLYIIYNMEVLFIPSNVKTNKFSTHSQNYIRTH